MQSNLNECLLKYIWNETDLVVYMHFFNFWFATTSQVQTTSCTHTKCRKKEKNVGMQEIHLKRISTAANA